MAEKNPFLIPLIGLIAGIMLTECGAPVWSAAVTAAAALIVYAIISRASRNPVKAYLLNNYHYFWIGLLFVTLGIITCHVKSPTLPTHRELSEMHALKGEVKRITYLTSGDKLLVELEGYFANDSSYHPLSGINALLYADGTLLQCGDRIIMPARLQPVKDPDNIYLPGYADRLRRQGIFYTINLQEHHIKRTGHSHTLSSIARQCRDRLAAQIELTPLSKELRAFLITILLGDKDYLDPETRNDFADAGISHMLALSGMHIAIMASFFLWILFPLNFTGRYKLRIFIVIVMIWIYAVITGMAPSTVRAAIMFSMAGAGRLFERKGSSFNALCCAALLILLVTPSAISDIGFQLSFICVASLIAFASYFNTVDQRRHPRLHKVNGIIIATLTATCTTWILAAYYFSTVPTLFLPANIVVLPLLPIFLALAIVSIICSSLGIGVPWLDGMLDKVYHSFTGFIGSLSEVGGSSALHVSPSVLSVLLWLLGVLLAGVYIHSKKAWRRSLPAVSVLSAASAIALLVFLPGKRAVEGFIVQDSFHTVSIMKYEGMMQSQHLPPSKSISMIESKGWTVIAADCNISEDSMPSFPRQCDCLIISRGFSGDIGRLLEAARPRLVAIHPSIFPRREAVLTEQCRKAGIKVHSLRRQGPLRQLHPL